VKRASILIVSLVAALCLSLMLCGCSSEKYEPQKKEQTVDNAVLHTSGTLRVGVDASNAPFAAESSGNIVGIDVDIAAALADEMGLDLELVDVGSDPESAFANEGVDIVMGVNGKSKIYQTTANYRESAVCVFSTDITAPAPTKKSKIAAQASSLSSWEITDRYGEKVLTETVDLAEAFKSLQEGTVDYVAADSTIGGYVAHTSGVDAYPVALLQKPTGYGIAVSKTNAGLKTAVDGALENIDKGGTIGVITNKWLGNQVDITTVPVLKS
jgi:polar amino acid transport system substrate-binding protein